eukprot:UN06014
MPISKSHLSFFACFKQWIIWITWSILTKVYRL